MIVSALIADALYGLVALNVLLAGYLVHQARSLRRARAAAEHAVHRYSDALGERPVPRHVRVREEAGSLNRRMWE